MSGHNKWTQIKRKKEITDKKRSQIFSKLLRTIAVAAKNDQNPATNPQLRAAIARAKENSVPGENIERTIKRSGEAGDLESLIMEAYGPEGVAIIITATTNSKNRTVSEARKIILDHHGKWADPGSVLWAFRKEEDGWKANFPQTISEGSGADLGALIDALDDHDDIDEIYTTAETIDANE